ncbi:MAG: helix-turn-helix transcriptional regulator [Bacteroidota bacterium]
MIRLTSREAEILHGISVGQTTKEIAQQLYLSDHTIISYRKTLFQKLGVSNAPAMVRRGFELGFLKLPQVSTLG